MTTEVKAAATKSLGEKLFDAVIFASDQSHDWSALPSDIQIRFEQSATIFAAEALSQATEENERLRNTAPCLYPSQPGETRAGLSVNGVCIEGSEASIKTAREWHWSHTAYVPAVKRQHQDLLEANNRYLERARTAEDRTTKAEAERDEANRRADALETLVNNPEVESFLRGVQIEAAHQVERWGADHDAGKEPQDWFWLVGYLGGKALAAALKGDLEKAKHHTISTAAAMANWHAQLSGHATAMRPGVDADERGFSALLARSAQKEGA